VDVDGASATGVDPQPAFLRVLDQSLEKIADGNKLGRGRIL
jgi:hypothetical protein